MGRIYSKDGISMSSVLPGAIFTEGGYWDTTSQTNPEHVEKYLKERMAIQRFGTLDEISNIITFLCSEHAGFIVGSAFTVDGGQGRCFFPTGVIIMVLNKNLRKTIVETITRSGEGHIPSSFSIIDIIDCIYSNHLNFDAKKPECELRDYFVLSKGHGGLALFVVLQKFGFITEDDMQNYGTFDGILGGHPDRTKVPGVEASTGSLGHGLPYSLGIALGQKIKSTNNKIFTLVGDGECHEGTIWESALVAQNLKLNNLCCIVDYNLSSAQILPHPNLKQQWASFGWNVLEVDGHNYDEMDTAFSLFKNGESSAPTVIIANTIKGKGVSFLESHGPWHHKIPNQSEFDAIMGELK